MYTLSSIKWERFSKYTYKSYMQEITLHDKNAASTNVECWLRASHNSNCSKQVLFWESVSNGSKLTAAWHDSKALIVGIQGLVRNEYRPDNI